MGKATDETVIREFDCPGCPECERLIVQIKEARALLDARLETISHLNAVEGYRSDCEQLRAKLEAAKRVIVFVSGAMGRSRALGKNPRGSRRMGASAMTFEEWHKSNFTMLTEKQTSTQKMVYGLMESAWDASQLAIREGHEAEIAKLRAALGRAGKALIGCKRNHYECEDSWYSCPKSEAGCADEYQKECNCGADERNAKIDAALADPLMQQAMGVARYSQQPGVPNLQVLIRHDDFEREYAYDEPDGASMKAANANGWLLVSMRYDWLRIFGAE